MKIKVKNYKKDQIVELYRNGAEVHEIMKELKAFKSLVNNVILQYESRKNSSIIFNVDELDCWICPTIKDIE
jgi:hypothetical protein